MKNKKHEVNPNSEKKPNAIASFFNKIFFENNVGLLVLSVLIAVMYAISKS